MVPSWRSKRKTAQTYTIATSSTSIERDNDREQLLTVGAGRADCVIQYRPQRKSTLGVEQKSKKKQLQNK
eukprot:5612884-Amphidinium_carterae.1